MTLMLNQIFKFIKLLNSDTGTNQIAAGIVCGMILGFSPVLSLQSLLVFTMMFFFRVQIGAALLVAPIFAIPAYLLDPVFHQIGSAILEMDSLRETFTNLYNMPIIPMTRFNNSVVMGAGVGAILLAPVIYIASLILIRTYRATVVARFQNTKIWKAWKATTLYQWYSKYEDFSG
jgi:uncharacterized protein (TIGR03546 family)